MTIIAATWAATAESKTQDLDTQASAHFVPTSYATATGYAGYPAYAAGYASYGAGYAGQGYAAGHNYATGLSHSVGGFYGYPAAGYYGYPVGGFGYPGYKHAAFDHGKFAVHG
ncbi:hypothetical protein M8J76_005342 [Diaphorina citri]|nr:hypothetical protein M8J76_005342 [Diaphorina citri]